MHEFIVSLLFADLFSGVASKMCNKKLEDEETFNLYEENSSLCDIFDKSYRKRDVKEMLLAAIIEELLNNIVVNQKKRSNYYSSHLHLWKCSCFATFFLFCVAC